MAARETRADKIRRLQRLVNRYGWTHPAVIKLAQDIESMRR